MGGRGTFAAGNNVPYKYKTVEIIEGVKSIATKRPEEQLQFAGRVSFVVELYSS